MERLYKWEERQNLQPAPTHLPHKSRAILWHAGPAPGQSLWRPSLHLRTEFALGSPALGGLLGKKTGSICSSGFGAKWGGPWVFPSYRVFSSGCRCLHPDPHHNLLHLWTYLRLARAFAEKRPKGTKFRQIRRPALSTVRWLSGVWTPPYPCHQWLEMALSCHLVGGLQMPQCSLWLKSELFASPPSLRARI